MKYPDLEIKLKHPHNKTNCKSKNKIAESTTPATYTTGATSTKAITTV